MEHFSPWGAGPLRQTIYVLIINSLTIYTSMTYSFLNFFLEKSHFQPSWLTLEELFKAAFTVFVVIFVFFKLFLVRL